jgi:peptidoglycan/LPS O-acetylase OafA/YrhL
MLKPLMFLGKISYSVYLCHLPVILCCIYILNNVIPLWSILIIAFICTIFVSFLSWYYIENTFIRIGKTLSSKNIWLKRKVA